MNLNNLIDDAKRNAGSLGSLAKELGKSQSRISEWKAGTRKPDASEIAFLAERAGRSVLATVAEIEAELNPRYAILWKNAVRAMAQNQG